ncbi:MAG: hypothetical protein EXR75_03720 [Myxococcales bacterium]|nr:hypothetical protein [Myxococcales bacterium]
MTTRRSDRIGVDRELIVAFWPFRRLAHPAFNSPAFNSPAFNSPAFNSPAFNSPAFNNSAFNNSREPAPEGCCSPGRRRRWDRPCLG